ncbi:MAG: BCD family MFS transporter [Rhodothermia bacterium]|nr:BCD family MFS transporter [Rhodothermia bacterium]
MDKHSDTPHPSLRRAFRFGLFQTGAALTDLLTSGIWNRILISDLKMMAWPVALLSALKYLLVPLTLWIGHWSDTKPLFRRYRLPYIFIGRLLVLIGLCFLPLSVSMLAKGDQWGWGVALFAMLLSGIGSTASGAPFLALVKDNFSYQKRGLAISIVETFLIASFALAPPILGGFMPHYSPDLFAKLTYGVLVVAGLLWLVSLWGAEPPMSQPVKAKPEPYTPVLQVVKHIWAEPQSRNYAYFVAASAFFAFMQDAMLEPFGGDVFALGVGETTRFNAWWGTGVLISMMTTTFLTRKWPPHFHQMTTGIGLAVTAVMMGTLGLVALMKLQILLYPTLFLLGVGFGLYGIGGYSLLILVNTDEHTGAYLALWTVVQLLARGAGIFAGGVIRDVGFALSGTYAVAYALLFCIEAFGLFLALYLLKRVRLSVFVKDGSNTNTNVVR